MRLNKVENLEWDLKPSISLLISTRISGRMRNSGTHTHLWLELRVQASVGVRIFLFANTYFDEA